MKQKTFRNLLELRKAQKILKLKLGRSYSQRVEPFIDVIKMVMKANNENEFEAIKRLKDDSEIYNQPGAALFFSSAVLEIVDEKYFKDLEKK